MDFEIILAIIIWLISFCVSFGLTFWWINVAKKNSLVGKDMNKFSKPLVAEAGGVAAIISIILSILFYIFIKTFFLNSETKLIQILTIIITLFMACFIGFIDDILGWKKGLTQWQKLLITIPVAIPLIVINSGINSMSIPFFGTINFGLIYPLILTPLAIMGATNGYNILAGYNGLEAGLGIIIFSFLGVIAVKTNQLWLGIIAGIIVLSLAGFFWFNKYPAKVFPGDSLTYSLGALIACFAVLGNMERDTLILFIPFIIEGVLKIRSKLKAENFGIPNKDNSLELRYEKNYSLTHLTLRLLKKIKRDHKAYEVEVVYILLLVEMMLGFIILFI